MDLLEEKYAEEDTDLVCSRQNWRLCHVGAANMVYLSEGVNLMMLISTTLFGLLFVLLAVLSNAKWVHKTVRKIYLYSIPNFLVSEQLPFLFAALNNLMLIRLGDAFEMSSFVCSVAILRFYLGFFMLYLFGRNRIELMRKFVEKKAAVDLKPGTPA